MSISRKFIHEYKINKKFIYSSLYEFLKFNRSHTLENTIANNSIDICPLKKGSFVMFWSLIYRINNLLKTTTLNK